MNRFFPDIVDCKEPCFTNLKAIWSFSEKLFHEAPVPVPGKKVQDEAEQKAKIDREQANELEYVDESQKSEATESANASSGSAGAKPVRNPEREKPK